MKFICRLFGHKWCAYRVAGSPGGWFCIRKGCLGVKDSLGNVSIRPPLFKGPVLW
jgi:hypothetical protein